MGGATRLSTVTPPMSTSTVTGERSRGHFIGARMLGGSLASSAALSGRQSPTGLPACVKLSLISAWSAAQVAVGRPLREHADGQREQPVQQRLADPGAGGRAAARARRGVAQPWCRRVGRSASGGQRLHAPAQPLQAGRSSDSSPGPASTSSSRSARHAGAQVRFALAAQPLGGPALAEAEFAAAFAAGRHQHAGGAVAQRVVDEGRRQLPVHSRLNGLTSAPPRPLHARAVVAAEDAPSAAPTCNAASACCRRRRSSLTVSCGMSMPVTSSGRAAERRRRRAGAGADAAAGAQVGIDLRQLTADALVGVRHHRDGGIGAVGEAAPAAVAVGGVDHRHRRARRLRQEGQREQRQRRRRPPAPTRRPARWHRSAGAGTAGSSPAAAASGTRASAAGAWLVTGQASASAASVADRPSASGRGGITAARVRRWMWNHSPNSSSSGTPRWTKTKSENRRSLDRVRGEEVARQRRGQQRQRVQPLGGGDGRELAELVPVEPEAADGADEDEADQRHSGQPVEAPEAALVAVQPFAQQVQRHRHHQHVGGVAVQAAQQPAQAQRHTRQCLDRAPGAGHRGVENDDTARCRWRPAARRRGSRGAQVAQRVERRAEGGVEAALDARARPLRPCCRRLAVGLPHEALRARRWSRHSNRKYSATLRKNSAPPMISKISL